MDTYPQGRHDPAMRRRAKRSARERGCWTYVPAELLVTLGIDPDGPPPYYRTFRGRRAKNPTVFVVLYGEA